MKSPNPIFTLHAKKLTTIWNPTYFHNKKVKFQTGEHIFNCLFTVACYATNNNAPAEEQLFAKAVCEKILDRISFASNEIDKIKISLESKSSGFFIRAFEPNDTFTLPYDQSRHGRETTKLIKLFLALDQLLLLLNRLRYEEEITDQLCTAKRNQAYKLLLACLSDLNVMCLNFHKIRKNPPNKVG